MNPMQRTDLSITCIFSAVQKPRSSTAQKCKAQIKAASVKELDYTFRKINQYKKKRQDDWPRTRLLRCIDYLVEHMVKLEPIVQLPSFIQCISWTLDHVNTVDDPQTNQMAIKVIAKTLERARSLDAKTQLLAAVSTKMEPEHWLFHSSPAVRIYALRALVTHRDAFAPRLSACVPQCLEQLTHIPSLLYTLSLHPKVTDYEDKKQQLEQLVMYARLLEGFVVDVETLLTIWTVVAKTHDGVAFKNRELLLYSLTSALYRSIAPPTTLSAMQSNTLLYLIDKLMRRWARDVCCSMHPPLCLPAVLEIEAKTLKKCLCIVLTLSFEGDEYKRHLVLGTINFFMCYVGQPVSPEETSTIGTDACISTNMCVDVDERGYQVQPVPQHQDLLNLLLEVFMQNVQRTPAMPMAGRVAWIIKSFFTIMLDAPLPSLFHRLEKVTVFMLHFDEAIDVLAASSTNISQHLWTPTIEQAKQGLMMAGLPQQDAAVLAKSKRAFIALEKISHHPRACERLVDCDVLQLVNAEWIPSGDVIQASDTLLVVYALFGRFIASLLHRTAFVRTRLRDELNLFPIMIQLLKEAVTHRHVKRAQWNHVVLGCLAVARTFQYDESSMRIWLQHNQLLPLMLQILLDQEIQWKTDARVMLATLGLLEQFAVQPLCGAQIINEEGALTKLATLLDYLSSASDGNTMDDDDSIDKEEKSDTEDMDQDEKQDDEEEMEEQVEEDQHLENEHNHPLGYINIVDMVLDEGEHTVPYTHHPKDRTYFDCAQFLIKSLIKILTCHDNLQYTILSDAFTHVFRPLTVPRWRRSISIELYQKKMVDLQALYHFTDNTENAMKLHELTAVAIGYAAIGAPAEDDWNTSLGLKQDISVSVFGIQCQMLIDETSAIKRDVAAQVMTCLGLEFKGPWDELHASILLAIPCPPAPTSTDQVHFKANEGIVTANRELLTKQSPIFQSMLGTTFVESTLQVIPIHDVTFHHFALFISVLQSRENSAHIIAPTQDWHSVIRIFQLADRFDTPFVKSVCEHWMMEQILHPSHATWAGLVSLYRLCRDPHPSEKTTWPFTVMVDSALRAMLLGLNHVCNTTEFRDMMEDEEAIAMFCDSLRILIIK